VTARASPAMPCAPESRPCPPAAATWPRSWKTPPAPCAPVVIQSAVEAEAEAFPGRARHQRATATATVTATAACVGDAIGKAGHQAVKDGFWKVFDTTTPDLQDIPPGQQFVEAVRQRTDALAAAWEKQYRAAIKSILTDHQILTPYLRFPAGHQPFQGLSGGFCRTGPGPEEGSALEREGEVAGEFAVQPDCRNEFPVRDQFFDLGP
jgi:hypothetical protein